MKRMRAGVLGAAVAVVVLAGACSNLIPPVEVNNLFGIDGVPIDLTAASVGVGASALPNGTSFEGTVSGSVVSEGFDLPAFINASLLEESVVIGADVQVTVPGEDARGVLTDFAMEAGQLSLQVRVDGTLIATASGVGAFDAPLALTRGACSFVVDTVCSYAAAVSLEDHAIVVTVTAASANAVFEAMQEGATLEMTGTYGVTLSEPGLTESAVVRVTLETSGGSISF
ncbi:MAG: hypothetical protein R6T93_11275 [Trueperaceae bacterium]